MALLSHATAVIEASSKSGTRHQAREAMRLGRPVYFTQEVAAKAAHMIWPKELPKQGTRVIQNEDWSDLVS